MKYMKKPLTEILQQHFSFRPNKNQARDLERLVFEIIKRENISLETILDYIKNNSKVEKYAGRNRFFPIKDALIKKRFPLTTDKEKIDTKKVFLTKVKDPLTDNWQVTKAFTPLKIFVEKEVSNTVLVKNFKNKFPQVNIEELDYYSQYLKEEKFTISQLKKPIVFIIKEKWDFIKPCPCTKHHLACGYWIFNLGFGCPFDCSYCFLQQYTNFPGIILPANLENFFEKFDAFAANLKKPIRIGTGEFCDSLALDHITQYSKTLIPYFKKKNVIFELKTKSVNIQNILEIDPGPNIVIAWSLNPESIAQKEELGAPSLEARIAAAKKVQEKGYKVAFHFDPIIHSPDWANHYKNVVDKIYSQLTTGFAWISLGTLRSNRELKAVTETRFPQSNIFYGELFLGDDRKLRYPEFLRRHIYETMIKEIRKYDNKTPIYLCMESKEMWQKTLGISNSWEIEESLLGVRP
jgi:spore photoproduct lyase